jgi:hypothetical protein
MDNKATTKRMIGAVVLVLVAALLLAWLLKGKNREGQQDMAMNQTGEVKPILGFAGVGDEAQKPSIVGDDPNAAAQQAAGAGQTAGIDVTQQQGAGANQQAGVNTIPGVDVKLPETVPNTTGFEVRPAGEVRDLVDIDNKVKDGIGSMGTGNAKAVDAKTGTAAPAPATQDATGGAGKAQPPAVAQVPKTTAPSASQQDKASTNNDAAPTEKKASSKVVLVNEKPVPRATSDASMSAAAEKAAAAKKAAEDKAAAIKKEVAEKAAAAAKVAAEKAAAAKSVALANAKPGTAGAGTAATTGAAGGFSIQVLASADKAKADAAAAPLKADGYNVAVSTATVGGKPVYRVNVSGFANRADAEAAQVKMKSRYKQNDAIQGSFVTGSK